MYLFKFIQLLLSFRVKFSLGNSSMVLLMNAPISRRDVLKRYVWPAVASIAFCLNTSSASETEGYKDGFSQSIYMGHSFFNPGTIDIAVLAPFYGYSRHTQYKQIGGGTNGDPGSLWRDTGENELAKAEI
jgi:hypothetical protein